MQESEFTGCANKVQGKPRNPVKFSAEGTKLSPSRSRGNAWPRPATHANKRARSAETNEIISPCVDASCRFLYDEGGRALSSAVRAFGLHPKGRPFKSDSAHHCDAPPISGDVVQLVRTLPRHSLESHTVTANSLSPLVNNPRTRTPDRIIKDAFYISQSVQ
jgi:hypothetical protein